MIKGQVQARQKLLDLKSFRGEDGITRCELMLGPEGDRNQLQPRRPFQGWRYLKPEDAPGDLSALGDAADLPEQSGVNCRNWALLITCSGCPDAVTRPRR